MNDSSVTRLHRCECQLRDFFEAALHGVRTETILEPAHPGKWSAHEHLAHLARYHEVFLQRIERILSEPCPKFERYRAEDDPGWDAWRALSFKEAGEKLAGLRERLIVKLKSLAPEDYGRAGLHPTFGRMTLALWLEFFLVHEAHHLYAVLQQVRSPR